MHENDHDLNRRALTSLAECISKTIKNTKQTSLIPRRIRLEQHVQNHNKTTPPSRVYTRGMIQCLCLYTWKVLIVQKGSVANTSRACHSCLVSSSNSTHSVTSSMGWGWMRGRRCQQNQTPKPSDVRMAHFSR